MPKFDYQNTLNVDPDTYEMMAPRLIELENEAISKCKQLKSTVDVDSDVVEEYCRARILVAQLGQTMSSSILLSWQERIKELEAGVKYGIAG